MDRDTLENVVKNLGKKAFDQIVQVILLKVFNLKCVDTDGKGDGGSDYRVFSDDFGTKSIAIQRSAQKGNWQKKAMDDVDKATKKLGATSFYYFSSGLHDATTLVSMERMVSAKYQIPVRFYGAHELTGFIIENDLLAELASFLDLPYSMSPPTSVGQNEIALHAYLTLSGDRIILREEIYSDAIQLCLFNAPKNTLKRDEVISSAIVLVGCDPGQRAQMTAQMDSLLTRGKIRAFGEDYLVLSSDVLTNINLANRIYLSELASLCTAQIELLQKSFKCAWTQTQSQTAAVILARYFIEAQLETISHLAPKLLFSGFSKRLGNPDKDLRELLRTSGVPSKSIGLALEALVVNGRENILIKKLARAATFTALEGADPLERVKAIGASSWNKVTVVLDASVGIPYLCAKIFGATGGRYSFAAMECLDVLRKVGAKIVITGEYINECASHLARSKQYFGFRESALDQLAYSENGYVSHYYKLKEEGKQVPASLSAFIAHISSSLKPTAANQSGIIREIEYDLKKKFADYGVSTEETGTLNSDQRTHLERAYMEQLRTLNRQKDAILVNHDIAVLAYLRRQQSLISKRYVCLTWDRAMIAVGLQEQDCGWIVTPAEASDLAQVRIKLSDVKLCSLAHSLAQVREHPSEMGAKIIDRIVQQAGEKVADWQFQERIRGLMLDILKRVQEDKEDFGELLDRETARFLKDEELGLKK